MKLKLFDWFAKLGQDLSPIPNLCCLSIWARKKELPGLRQASIDEVHKFWSIIPCQEPEAQMCALKKCSRKSEILIRRNWMMQSWDERNDRCKIYDDNLIVRIVRPSTEFWGNAKHIENQTVVKCYKVEENSIYVQDSRKLSITFQTSLV